MDASHAYLATRLSRLSTDDRLRDAAQRRQVREARRQPTVAAPQPARHSPLWHLLHLRRTYA